MTHQKKLKIVELFTSIDGEGKRSGSLASFIRLAGCNLKCAYCDTRYAWDSAHTAVDYNLMSEDEILDALNPDIKNITLTGGEPLLADGVKDLISRLIATGFNVNVETNGAVDIAPFRDIIKDKSFFTIDYKLPSSGMEKYMIESNFFALTPDDVLKFVVGSQEDIAPMTALVGRLKTALGNKMPKIYLGTVWGNFEASHLVKLMIDTPLLRDAVLQLQMHKFIWSPNERGV